MPFFEILCNVQASLELANWVHKANRKLLSEYEHLHSPVATEYGGYKDILFKGTTVTDRSILLLYSYRIEESEREREREREMKRRKTNPEYEL
jgi:hypothetical protein